MLVEVRWEVLREFWFVGGVYVRWYVWRGVAMN
jgi:hypothetical protein